MPPGTGAGMGEGGGGRGVAGAKARPEGARWSGRERGCDRARVDLGAAVGSCSRDGQRVTIAAAGAGGRGNKRFATATRQAPRFAERGLPGEEGWVELRLRLLADVGLVGMPNAGKSSLLARLTRAAPRVAAYPSRRLEPVLGVLETADGASSSWRTFPG